MSLRDARAAVLRRYHRNLADNFAVTLPRVLDELDAADREHAATMPREGGQGAAGGDGTSGTGNHAPRASRPAQQPPAARTAGRRATRKEN